MRRTAMHPKITGKQCQSAFTEFANSTVLRPAPGKACEPLRPARKCPWAGMSPPRAKNPQDARRRQSVAGVEAKFCRTLRNDDARFLALQILGTGELPA